MLSSSIPHPNLTYHNIGLSERSDRLFFSEHDDNMIEMMTLKEILTRFGDLDKEITYLKVDIKGHEIPALLDWMEMKKSVLKNVQQFQLEMHLFNVFSFNEKNWKNTYLRLIHAMQKMYSDLGLKLVWHSSNGCTERDMDVDQKYNSLFDLIFVKE